MRRQTFRAPGTWTNPGTVTQIKVIVVGGGGGGGVGPALWGHGGGGGYREGLLTIPTSPVPVTVGAGGAGGAKPGPDTANFPGSIGGTTSFGTPSDPWALIVDGGGAGGGSVDSSDDAPPIGGGGGSNDGPLASGQGGAGLGFLGQVRHGGAGNKYGVDADNAPEGDWNLWGTRLTSDSPKDRYGFCGGGNTGRDGAGYNSFNAPIPLPVSPVYFRFTESILNTPLDYKEHYRNAIPNTGGGGAGFGPVSPNTTAGNAGSGGSGIVILEWWE